MRPAKLTLHLGHLLFNYKLLCRQAKPRQVMAVVKADAYGHGLRKISAALYQAGCRMFAVTDAEEGCVLRQNIGKTADIVVLSGVFDENDAFLCQEYNLTPVLSEYHQLHCLVEANFKQQVWLKLDTGMHRIGVLNLTEFMQQLRQQHIKLAGVMSHLACADTPQHPLNQQQMQCFQALTHNREIPALSLFNSAGIMALHDTFTDIVRPGIALYGVEAVASPVMGLKPVMQLSSQIIQIRPVAQGECVSYGATWSAKEAGHIAIVAMGYADGLPRLLSNQGEVAHVSGRLPIVGRVCMDYCMLAVDVNKVNVGDEVIFFGYQQAAPRAADVAEQCQSIAYELLTNMPQRIRRCYIQGE